MHDTAQAPHEVPRTMMLVIIIGLLLAGSLWTLVPFLGGLAWATMIVVATWPILLLVQRKVGGRRSVAVAIMTLLALAAFIAPLLAAVSTLLDAAARSPAILRDYVQEGLGPPPAWVVGLPGIGERIADRWTELSTGGPEALVEALRPYARTAAASVLGPVILAATYTLARAWIAESTIAPDTAEPRA